MSKGPEATGALEDPSPSGEAGMIRAKTIGRIRSYVESMKDWNQSRSLKNLVEQTVRDYEHRALIELLQNASDAHDPADRAGIVEIHLIHDEGEHGVLYVANGGNPFSVSNFDAVVDVAQSDKRPEEGIGNKGIGFKSVLQLTRSPEIYSMRPGQTNDASFGGFCFGFAPEDSLRTVVAELYPDKDAQTLCTQIQHDVLRLFLPVHLPVVPDAVSRFATRGHVTVIRLPLKSEEARTECQQQMESLQQDPPTMLFLNRLKRITLSSIRDGDESSVDLERSERELKVEGVSRAVSVDLAPGGTYVVVEREIPSSVFSAAITRSVEGDHLSQGWEGWSTAVTVAVALRSDTELGAGRLYTYLPMGEGANAPLAAHVNAPFFAKLARVSLEVTVPLNEMLLDQVADLCADVLLADNPESAISAGNRADLLSWTDEHGQRLQAAFTRRGTSIADAPVVPLHGEASRRGTLSESFIWASKELRVFTASELMARAKAPIVATLSASRNERLDRFAAGFALRTLRPSDADVAGWSEHLAHATASKPFDADAWATFYDDLKRLVQDPKVLRGRKILIDSSHKLRNAATDSPNARGAAAFFPRSETSDAPGERTLDIDPPKSLRKRLFFLAPEIEWNLQLGSTRFKRDGRRLLEDGLVREYRAADVLQVVAAALSGDVRNDTAEEVLLWTFRFADRTEARWRDIVAMDLRVPVANGKWIRPAEATLSAAWGGPKPELLGRLLADAEGYSESLANLRERLVLGPTDPPFRGLDHERIRAFLVRIGVREGLWPQPVPNSKIAADGRYFDDPAGIVPGSLSTETTAVWLRYLRRTPRRTGLKPYTSYQSEQPLLVLPGQDDFHQLPQRLKALYAELVAHGLGTWPDEVLAVNLRRYNNAADNFSLPTPALAFIAEAEWLPVTGPKERTRWTYVDAQSAWTHHEENAPAFATVIPPPVGRLLHVDPQVTDLVRSLGVRDWSSQDTGSARIRLLAQALKDGDLAETARPQFLNAYETAWRDFLDGGAAGSPFSEDDDPVVVVSCGTKLDIVDLSAVPTIPVFVLDVDDRQRSRLLEQCGAVVLEVRNEKLGTAILDRLGSEFDRSIVRVSDTSAAILVDGLDYEQDVAHSLLINEKTEWLVDVLAAVMQLKSGVFRRTSAAVLRRGVERLRSLRLVVAGRLHAELRSDIAGSTEGSEPRWLTAPSAHGDTILVVGDPKDLMRVLESASAPVAELVNLPEIGAELALALVELARMGRGPEYPPDASAIARALDVSVELVREAQAQIQERDSGAVQTVAPLLACLSVAEAHVYETNEQSAASLDDAIDRLINGADSAPDSSDLRKAILAADLDAARRILGFDLATLNSAIRELGPGYVELCDPDGISQQFRAFIAGNKPAILTELRIASLDEFRAQRPLTSYCAAVRELEELTVDDSWLMTYLEVPNEVLESFINDWLDRNGALPLHNSPPMPKLQDLKKANRDACMQLVERALDLVSAWEHANQFPISGLPGEPHEACSKLDEAGVFDFEILQRDALIARLSAISKWPTGMPMTVDLEDLGVSETSVVRAHSDRAAEQGLNELRKRRVHVDGVEMDATESSYPEILDAVRKGIAPGFLDSTGVAPLTDPGQGGGTKHKNQNQGRTAARRLRHSDVQSAAIGLAGEVCAAEWLKAHYPEYSEDSWVSGYRNQILGDGKGDDTLGYDFVIDTSKKRLMFEVKASTGDVFEFIMSEGEMNRALDLKRREEYQILFVANAMDGELRSIWKLPNPLDPRNASKFRTLGQGLRYQFKLAEPLTDGAQGWHS